MSVILKAFDFYLKHGIETLPVQQNKQPKKGVKWKDIQNRDAFTDAFGIGIKCGKQSGGIECLDFDNHLNNAMVNVDDFMSDVDIHNLLLAGKLAIAQTQSGGFHLVFKSDYCEGNQKLASQIREGKEACVIETRGEGGYFCAAPTQGYKWVEKIPQDGLKKVTEAERNLLISSAKSFHEAVTETNFKTFGNFEGERIGDRYNSDAEAIDEARRLLENAGWTFRGIQVTRPGKKPSEGFGATFGKVAPNVFYVFTSNGTPFEPESAYKPFQIKTLLEFNGDFKACAKALYEKYGVTLEPQKKKQEETHEVIIPSDDLDEMLRKARIDVSLDLPKPPTVLSIVQRSATQTVEIDVFSMGDFSVLTGKQKAKKTFLISMFAAAMNVSGQVFQDRLLAKLPNNRKRVAVFDTEQGEWYAHKTAKRIYNNSNQNTNLDYFFLRSTEAYTRRKLIERYFEKNSNVGYAVIDGAVDLLYDFNSQEESAKLIQWIMDITAKYHIHITLIIHQNKADGNARGHLGTMLTQKAETVIEIEKDKNNPSSSFIRPSDTRGKDFNEFLITIDGMGNPFFEEVESTGRNRNIF